MFSATAGTMPAGVRRSGCPEHGDPWGRKDLNLRSRETPGLQPGPFGRLGNTPVGGPTRRRLGGSSSSPARWAGAMRPAPRPGGRSGVRSPIEHRKAPSAMPVAGFPCSGDSLSSSQRPCTLDSSWRRLLSGADRPVGGVPDSRCRPGGRQWNRKVVIVPWGPIGGMGRRWTVRPSDCGTGTTAEGGCSAVSRFRGPSPRSRRKARRREGPVDPGDDSSWHTSGLPPSVLTRALE